MAFGLRLTVDARGASRKLKRVDKSLRATLMLEAMGKAIVRFSRLLFSTRGRAVGGWKPLSPNTIAAKGVDSPLVTSGDLLSSIDYKVIPGARVQVGTDVEYAKYHHFGTRPYRIVPVQAKALSFMTAGGRVFTKSVQHPGLPRRRILPDASQARKIAAEAAQVYIRDTIANG